MGGLAALEDRFLKVCLICIGSVSIICCAIGLKTAGGLP